MRLRLNTTLRAALIAAITAVGFTLSQATASTVLDGQTYSGDVYTWSKGGTSQADMAYGGWKKTTQGESGYIYEAEITKWDPTIKGLIANGGSTTSFSNDLNTIRFATDTGSNTNMTYTFFPLSVGGIIAENAGYTITAGGANRPVYIGNATATAARSDIKGNFTINTSGAGDNGTMTFMGTQTWNVASGATFTLNSGKHAKTVSGALSITGGGTVAFDGTGTVAMTGDSSLEIQANTTLQVSSGLTMAASGATVTNNGNLQLGGTIKFGAAGIENNGTVSLTTTGLVFDLSQLTDQDNTYTLFTGSSAVDLSTLGLSSANITGIVTVGKTFTFHDNGTITFEAATKKTWTAQSAANWNYEDENWDGGKFVSGDGALFNLDESMATVNAAVEASGIEVASGSTVTLNVSGAGSLSSASVVIADGATMISNLSINNVEEFSVGSGAAWNIFANQSLGKGTNNGTIYLGAEGTARLTDASNSKDLLLGITGTGDIELAVNTNIEGGTNEATKVSSKATGKLIIDQGVTLGLGRPAISGGFSQRFVDLSSFSAVDLNGGTLQVHMNNLVLNNLTVNTANSSLKVLDTAGVGSPALTLQGTTTLNKDLTLTSNWKHQIVIKKLAGTGALNLNGSDNSVVNIGTLGGDTGTVGKISVQSDATKATLNGTLTITGNLEAKKGTTNIAGTVDVKGEIDLSAGSSATGTILVKNGGSLTAPGMWGRSAAHLNIEKGGTVNLAKLSIVGADSEHLASITTTGNNTQYGVTNNTWTISNASITAKDNVTIGNLLTNSSIDAGAHTVSLTNAGNTLTGGSVAEGGSLSIAGATMMGSAIENAGNVTLTGTIDISFMDYEDASTYVGGANAGNGFAVAAYEYTIVTDATKLDMSGATIEYFEQNITSEVVDGKYTLAAEDPDYSKFYVNNRSETVTKAKSGQETLEAIVVAADGTLEVDQNIDLSLIDSTSTGTLDIAADKTVTAGDATTSTKLAGEGTIVLKSGATNLAGATMTEDWAGTAKVTGTINNIDLNNYGQTGSKVEMNGVDGYFLQAQKEFAPELVLGEDGLTITDGYSTLASGDPKPPTKYTFAGGVSGEGDMTFDRTKTGVVTQHLYFTGDVSDWLGSLSVVKGFTVYAQYSGTEQEVNSTIHRTVGTLNVEVGTGSDADVVTFNRDITADSFTVMQGATANVYENLTATTIAVNAGGTMNMDGGTLSTAITNNDGTVSLSGITLGNGFEEIGGEETYVAVDGTTPVTDEDNYYLGHARGYVTVVTGSGEVSGSDITWNDGTFDLQDDGTITTTAAGTNFDTFYINKGSENISDILANDTTAVQVNAGTLVVNQDATGVNITVKGEGTITGEKADAKQVGIEADATAYYTGAVEDSGVRFSPGGDMSEVVIVNNGDATKTYSTTDKALGVAAQKLEMIDTQNNVTVSNTVVVDELVNTTGKVLTLDNTEALLLNSMTITGSTVEVVYTNEQMAPVEGTVMIVEALSAGGATLKADLTLYGGSTLDVDGGAANALTLGSTLAIDTTVGLVNLDEDTIAALNQLGDGESLDLIVAAQGTGLSYKGAQTGMWYNQLFNRVDGLQGDYTVYANDGAFGLTKFSNVPEPTTGTLSLLALAALAARRRRK